MIPGIATAVAALTAIATIAVPEVSSHEVGLIVAVPVVVEATTTPVVLHPDLMPICACESVGRPDGEPRHYAAGGDVLRGRINPDDIGMRQINRYYHEEDALALGFDIWQREGNVRYANWLYERQGSQPWFWSRHCWNS